MDDELLDVVNGHDQVVGTINRKDYDQLLTMNDSFIRAAELFIVNDKNELWVPTRTAHKTIAPSGFDYSAAGHVTSGDDTLATIIKEAAEEINLQLTSDMIEFVAQLKSLEFRYIRTIYLLRSNQTPTFNPNDFVSAQWMTADALLLAIADGHPTKVSIPQSVEILKAYLSGV